MAKAVLISIRPEWVGKILSGEKALEVRKNRPNLNPPFKCYIYCARGRKPWVLDGVPGIRQDGHVVAEFECDKITWLTHIGFAGCSGINLAAMKNHYTIDDSFDFSESCLTILQLEEYLDGGDGYAWHISDLKIYGKPKGLSEFTGLRKTKFGYAPKEVKHPPQSWCYVEELENG